MADMPNDKYDPKNYGVSCHSHINVMMGGEAFTKLNSIENKCNTIRSGITQPKTRDVFCVIAPKCVLFFTNVSYITECSFKCLQSVVGIFQQVFLLCCGQRERSDLPKEGKVEGPGPGLILWPNAEKPNRVCLFPLL